MSKVYVAAPFFNAEQLELVQKIEVATTEAGFDMFSPRLGANAVQMNAAIKRKEQPSKELREAVFNDNWMNIDNADLLVAVIDNFDVGVVWEIGYAFARHIPIITFTNKNYGCNLMLAHSIVAHVKSIEALKDIYSEGPEALSLEAPATAYADVVARIQAKYKSDFSLKEGPDERNQAA